MTGRSPVANTGGRPRTQLSVARVAPCDSLSRTHTIAAEEIGGIYMKRRCLLALATGFFSACTAPPFIPQTLEGARCKLDCIDRASVVLLGSSYGRCLEACMDIDRLSQARGTTL
jgi:hypothetical protein